MKRNDSIFVKHIIDSAGKIKSFTEGKLREDLDSDEKPALARRAFLKL